MANTLKFGNGQWATKVGSTLAYNDENGNFKPLPFNFTRATSATRVNKDGLIEVVTNNKPRVDFKDDANGALLLEPERTNLIPSNVSDWVVFQSNVTQSNQSPDGYNNAIKITSNAVVNSGVYLSGLSVSGNTEIFTIWLKGENGGEILEIGDATNRTTVTLTNEWVRYEAKAISASSFKILYNQTTNPIVQTWYAWGPQLEDNVSYATSYIPTQGSQVTRVAESCSQTPPSGIIGQTEGTIFVDFNINNLENQTNDPIVLSFNSSNYIEIFDNGRVNYYDGTGNIDINLPSYGLTNGRHKFGIAYNINDVAFYIDGTLAGTDTSCSPSAKSSLYLGYTNVAFLPFISYNEVKLYNTRLSNSELQQLTSL